MLERARKEWPWVAAVLALALLIAALDPAGEFFRGLIAYLTLFFFGGLLLRLLWRWLRPSDSALPLVFAIGTAIILRLLFGVVFTQVLPSAGYPDSEPHKHGYYYLDAYDRDSDAWRIAHDKLPLLDAFLNPERSDQYGGLLFLSASTYRILSADVQRPLLITGLAAIAGSLALLFTWGFTSRAFGTAPALGAAWVLAIFPEAIFLGSSPMREPFLIAALAASLYGYVLFREGERGPGMATMLVSLALTAVLSPPYAFLFAITLIAAWFWEGGRREARLILGIGAVVVVALLLTIGAWSQIGSAPQGSLLGLLDWWITSGAQFELHKLEAGSGIIQKYFELAPEWAHVPLATAYGLVQPFLPATLMDSTSLPLPRVLGVLRGLGWFALLPMLIYAPFVAVRVTGWRSLNTYLVLLIWLVAIGAAYRLGGDQWDNPRARTVYLAGQGAIAGWVWFESNQRRSPWLRRIIIVVAVSTLGFLQWYAGRYYYTPRLNLYETVGAIVGFALLFLGGMVLWDRRRLTSDSPEV